MQRLNNLEVIITSALVAFGSACFPTCANDCEWGPHQSADYQEGWLASEAYNVSQEELQVTAPPGHSLRPEAHAFNPDANDVSRPCRGGVITSLLDDSQEKKFDDLKATIQASSFPSELSGVLRGAGARLQRVYRSVEGQQIVHERVDETIKVELDVNGYRYKPGDLWAASVAFITIANALPEYDLNDLCRDLAQSLCLAEGGSVGPAHFRIAKKCDGTLIELGLFDLRDEAGDFLPICRLHPRRVQLILLSLIVQQFFIQRLSDHP